MRPADYSQVLRLWKAAAGVHVGVADDRAGVGRYLRRNRGMSFVAVRGGEVVGAILCGHDGRRGYLHHLAVGRLFRKMGIGKMLVGRGLTALRDCGLARCEILAINDDPGRIAFWKKAGFRAYPDVLFMAIDSRGRRGRAGRKKVYRRNRKRTQQ